MKTNQLWLLVGALAALGCGSDDRGLFDENAGKGDGGSSKGDGGSREPTIEERTCGKHAVRSDKAIPDMLIVLDRSASMGPQGNNRRTNRWQGSAEAVTRLTNNYSSSVNFGLMTFPGNQAGGLSLAQCTAGQVDVEIGADNGPAIQGAIGGMRPNGYTPTAKTLEAAAKIIGSPSVTDQKKTAAKYVLLVTDGDPNCSEDFNPGFGGGNIADPRARMETIAAIEALTKQDVKTYVVGYETGGSEFAGQLDLMAAAGGTGETKHRSVESAQDLADTFDELAANASNCSYRLADDIRSDWVLLVTVGKTARKFGDADGWQIASDNRTVTLVGKACEDAKDGQLFTVEVTCGTEIGI